MKRTSFLEHIGWTGAGILWTVGAGGLAVSQSVAADASPAAGISFVQISDSHIGFNKAANEHTVETLQKAIDAINAMPKQPAFVMHTGDITHLTKPTEFDTAKQVLASLRAPLLTLPGEHDVIGSPKEYFAHFGRADAKDGWYSWDQGGVHFVALVNVFTFEGEKMGVLGDDQLAWLKTDLQSRSKDTPIVVFGHVPLYALYPQWGWTTEDGSKALALLARFSSVTVLNGHIHQTITHTEGNIKFYTANATAFPQPAPGKAEQPGPLKVPADQLLKVLGYRTVEVHAQTATVNDLTLG